MHLRGFVGFVYTEGMGKNNGGLSIRRFLTSTVLLFAERVIF